MIPKRIHYCWFGGNELGEIEQKCIQSWRKYLPGWEIIEWNENNYDINKAPYTKEAYTQKKWAFVSDVVRLEILYKHGGLYFDTDVELIKPIDDIIEKGDFMGIESYDNGKIFVNPGLIMGMEPGNPVVKDILETYKDNHFFRGEHNSSKCTIVERTTKILKDKYRMKNENCLQKLREINIYPCFYFCPMNYQTGEMNITEDTHSIHWYSSSWLTEKQKKRMEVTRRINNSIPSFLAKAISFVYLKCGAVKDIFVRSGIRGILKRIFHIT